MIVPSPSTGLLRPNDVSGPDTNYEVVWLRFVSVAVRCWAYPTPTWPRHVVTVTGRAPSCGVRDDQACIGGGLFGCADQHQTPRAAAAPADPVRQTWPKTRSYGRARAARTGRRTVSTRGGECRE